MGRAWHRGLVRDAEPLCVETGQGPLSSASFDVQQDGMHVLIGCRAWPMD